MPKGYRKNKMKQILRSVKIEDIGESNLKLVIEGKKSGTLRIAYYIQSLFNIIFHVTPW